MRSERALPVKAISESLNTPQQDFILVSTDSDFEDLLIPAPWRQRRHSAFVQLSN